MKEKVLILRCDSYDKELVSEKVTQGIKNLGIKPSGNVFMKPNVVFAHYDQENWGNTIYTNPQFVAGVLHSLNVCNTDAKIKRVDIGEKAGIGIPTRMVFKWAGYDNMVDWMRSRVNYLLKIFAIEEDKRKEIYIGGKIHSFLRVSQRLVNSDFVISLPKLKGHGLVGMTCVMKLNVGILNDDMRGIRHDYSIHEKIVDTVEAVKYPSKPQLIIVDGIKVGIGMEMGAKYRKLGVIIMGTNHLAVDLVAGYLYNLRPPEEKIGYIKAAINRGFKPTSLDGVDIIGDYPGVEGLDLLAEKLKPYDENFYWWCNTKSSLERVKSPIKYYQGPVDTIPKEIWCGSCDMALRIACASIEMTKPESFSKGRPLVIVTGRHHKIDAHHHDVLMIGKCAHVKELLNAGKIKRINRCFTTVFDLTFVLPAMADLPNPILYPKFLFGFILAYIRSCLSKLFNGYYLQDLGYFLKYRLLRKI